MQKPELRRRPTFLSLASFKQEAKGNSFCYNEQCVPDDVSSTEQVFHDFLDAENIKELNVASFFS